MPSTFEDGSRRRCNGGRHLERFAIYSKTGRPLSLTKKAYILYASCLHALHEAQVRKGYALSAISERLSKQGSAVSTTFRSTTMPSLQFSRQHPTHGSTRAPMQGHWSGLARIRVTISNGGSFGAVRAPMQGSSERASPNPVERFQPRGHWSPDDYLRSRVFCEPSFRDVLLPPHLQHSAEWVSRVVICVP
jgi:hypothetical protein